MFDSELLDNRHGPFNMHYLEKIDKILQYALEDHSRTLAVRVDLRLSPSWVLNDTLTCHPNLQDDLISRFVCSVKAKVIHYRKRLVKEGKKAHACTPRYFWVKEIDSAEFPHYHLVMFFNKDLFRGLGRFDSEDHNLASMIRQAWLSALDLKGYDEYQSLVHFPKNGVYTLDRNAPDFVNNFNNLVFRLSYLAKENTKVYSPNERSMGCSQK
ncbi:Inovirus Gp2 family protein [Enterobacter cancerogenus]|uniref:inovirus Gp2 family protein n=1 Tax=Enterobacter cancerogenus TaxID=69218 RepID=UPI0019281A74|nr:inovirus Gp2 family protein [Enterobacter cancerogenus]CAD5358524.1 Inovirus Gp2 family protein [Enterobacter cancerogenus]